MTSFATPAELTEFAATTLETDRMQALLDIASATIRLELGQTVSEVLGDQVEYGPWELTGDILFLPERPVTAVSAVEVDGSAVTEFTWTRWGTLKPYGDLGTQWTEGVVVTYDHGYAADTEEIAAVKGVCLAAASRAFTLNERSASEAIGSTLMQAAGYSPEVFLTQGEKELLRELGAVPVG